MWHRSNALKIAKSIIIVTVHPIAGEEEPVVRRGTIDLVDVVPHGVPHAPVDLVSTYFIHQRPQAEEARLLRNLEVVFVLHLNKLFMTRLLDVLHQARNEAAALSQVIRSAVLCNDGMVALLQLLWWHHGIMFEVLEIVCVEALQEMNRFLDLAGHPGLCHLVPALAVAASVRP